MTTARSSRPSPCVKDMTALREAEAALAESEQLFRLTFDQAPIGAALVGLDFRFRRVNARFAYMTGYSMDELLERGFPEITHPDDVAADVVEVRRLAAGEIDEYARQKRYVRKDGSVAWGDVVVRPVTDDGGRPLAFVAMVADVTERRTAELALRESEERLPAAAPEHERRRVRARDASRDARPLRRRQRPRLRDAGVLPRGVAGDGRRSHRRPRAAPSDCRRSWRRCHERGRAVFETEHLTKEGRRLPVEVSVRVARHRGRHDRVFSVARDITERRAAEAEAAKAQRLLDETQEISKLGGWEYDVAAGRFTWTEELYRLHGVDPDFDVNDLRRNVGFYAPEDQAVIDAAFAAVLETGVPYDLELQFRPAGADRAIWVRTTARAEMRDGRVVRVIGNLADIDERKQAETALAAERERARTYLDLAGVMIVAVRSDGIVTVANRKACQVLEREESDVVGQDWFRLAIAEDVSAAVRDVFDGLMRGEAEPWDYFENEVVTATGERRLVAWHNVLLHDADGSITGTLSSGEDITQRRQNERALRETEERYRSLFEQSPVSVWEEDFSAVRDWLDAQGAVDDWHACLRRASGARPALRRARAHPRVQQGGARLLRRGRRRTNLAAELPRYFTEESYPAFRDELAALAGGDKQFAAEIPIVDLEGTRHVLDLRVNVVPGHEACSRPGARLVHRRDGAAARRG